VPDGEFSNARLAMRLNDKASCEHYTRRTGQSVSAAEASRPKSHHARWYSLHRRLCDVKEASQVRQE